MSAASMAGRLAGKSKARGRKVCSQKAGLLGKGKAPGVTIVSARNCSRGLSLNGSVLQKVSDVLKVEETEK